MWAVTPGLLEALAGPHRIRVHVEIRKGGKVLHPDLPFTAGSITVTGSSPVRRSLSLTVPPRLVAGAYADRPSMPQVSDDPLGAFGQEAHVQYGVVFSDDSVEWIPVGVFRLDSASGGIVGDDPAVQVTGVSRESFVVDARFVSPRTLSSPSTQALVAQLIREVLPSAEVVVTTRRDARVPTMTVDEDRWGTISSLAEAIGAVVFCDGWGRFVLAPAPSTTGLPVWTARAGSGGVLVSAATSTSRAEVRNAIVVRGESPGGDSPPVHGVVYDNDPRSPTRWGDPAQGAFGMAPRFESYPTVSTVAQAQAVGRALLASSTGVARTLDVSTVPNPALEAGDLIHVIPDADDPAGSVRAHIVDRLTIPLTAGGSFDISTREVREVIT